jgi:uncharacterized RDD family membrane protein YckC
MEPSSEPVLETQAIPVSRIAGFWRRVGALVVDGVVLGSIGFPLGLLLGERLAPVGTPARLIGLLVIIPYLGVLGSQVGNGQTVGKRLLGIRVVDADGNALPLNRSLVRALLLSLPWILNGIRFGSLDPVVMITLWVAGVLIFGVGGAIIGTFALNRRTRQALHDLVVGSYVVRADGLGLHVPVVSTRTPMVASLAWIGLVAIGTTVSAAMAPRLASNELSPALMESVSAIPGTNSFEITHLTVWGGGRTSTQLRAVLWCQGPSADTERAARQMAAAMLQHHPDAATAPNLGITVIRGWDIGIAKMTRSESLMRSPAQWRTELGQ